MRGAARSPARQSPVSPAPVAVKAAIPAKPGGGIIAAFKGFFSRNNGQQKTPPSLGKVEEAIGYAFADKSLLGTALKHRSYVYSHDGTGIDSNERLEFLGDAVVDLVVTHALYRRFPEKREGELTQAKSLIVSKTVLTEKAHAIELGSHILLSQEEEFAGGRRRTSIVSDAYEALVGAIYLDGGLKAADAFLQRSLLNDMEKVLANDDYLNFKSMLLEHIQSQKKGQPEYCLHAEEGPDHQKTFVVEVKVHGRTLARGEGRSKKQAEQRAAKEALRSLKGL